MPAIKMHDNEYFALGRLSFSSMKHLLDSPAKFLHQKSHPFTGNEYTELGTAIHNYLQGAKDMVAFEPDLSHIKTKEGFVAKNPYMTNEGKALIKEFRAQLPKGVVAVPFETKAILEQIEKQFKENPYIKEVMDDITHTEQAYLETVNGLEFKGKLDFEGKNFIVDLKSTGKPADVYSFKRTIYTSHYDLQAAIYLTMKAQAQKVPVDSLDYYIFAVETFAPYEIVPYKLSQETINHGFMKLDLVCSRYKEYIITKKSMHYTITEI